MKRQIITFAGNKEALHKQLKAWSVEAEISVNKTVINLIEKHLKKYENNKLKKNG
jgi:ABC-type hemin transport system substrate-binding protein